MKVVASMIDDTSRLSDTYSRLYCRQRFATCVASPEAELDLASAALWLAAEDCPELDAQVYLGRLESLADRVRVAWGGRLGSVAALDALRSVLVEEENFIRSSLCLFVYLLRNLFLKIVGNLIKYFILQLILVIDYLKR